MTILAPRRDPVESEESRQTLEALIREARQLRRQRFVRRMFATSLAIAMVLALLSVTGALGARVPNSATDSGDSAAAVVRHPIAEVVTFTRTSFSTGSGGPTPNTEVDVLATSLRGPLTGFYEMFRTVNFPSRSTPPQLDLAITVSGSQATSYRLSPFAGYGSGSPACGYSPSEVTEPCDVSGLTGTESAPSAAAGAGTGALPMLIGIPGNWYSPSKLTAGLRRIAAGPFVALGHTKLHGVPVAEYRVSIEWNTWYGETLKTTGPGSGWSVADDLVEESSGMAAPSVLVWLDQLGRICKLVTPSGAVRYVTTITYLRHPIHLASSPAASV